jgi:hypothetical protein
MDGLSGKKERMFAGHLSAALILKRGERGVGLGTLWFAAMLLDFVLWILVLCGIESLHVPPGYRRASDLAFDFPYSHSLVASIGWASLGFAVGWGIYRPPAMRMRASLIIAAAVFSHFILDWLVHVPELPVAGRDSVRLGLGLWRQLPVAWAVEGAFTTAGLWLYLKAVTLSRPRRVTLVAVMVVIMVFTVIGQASTAPPPNPSVMAATSLGTIAVLVVFGWWLEREPNRS